ncbi:hypothetical protein DPMN_010501 [Dreissena polymorpha]|uniref:Uncharacterized protein n=1 Tax=Dreissena polymorpha TaxID=45954 RepID=A0A9D4N1M0_DREPO|nr:hypothetical protein DPMN_010501 [Dreissena polymorpha]
MEPQRKKEERAAMKHLAPRPVCRCLADWQNMGAAGDTRPEPRRLEEAGWRPMSQMRPQANKRLDDC